MTCRWRHALSQLRGSLRVDVYNLCMLMLHRVKAAVHESPSFRDITVSDVEDFLSDQARTLVKLLRLRPCPHPDSITDVTRGASEVAIHKAVGRVREVELSARAYFDDDRKGAMQPSDILRVLEDMCEANKMLVELGHVAFKTSSVFLELLGKVWAP